MTAPDNRVFSLIESRWLTERRRREWQRELVRFQIDEINVVYDGLALSAGTDAHPDRVARATTRIGRRLRAASWLLGPFQRELRALLKEPLDHPEDAFGIAALLLGLGLDSPEIRSWLARLDHNVRARLHEVGLAALPG